MGRRLKEVECPTVTWVTDNFPVFWKEALGCLVADVDGNIYLDLTAAFGVANVGHRHPRVVQAVVDQAQHLLHGMGDVHPADLKLVLLERLRDICPGDLGMSVLGSSGSDAVEVARKACLLHTGRPGILAFTGGYHGLTYGALEATWRQDFRRPFSSQLKGQIQFVPYPDPFEDQGDVSRCLERSLARVQQALDGPEGQEVGGILLEVIQGRGGAITPPDGFLAGLRRLCDARGLLLIFDEVFTGFGRTGTLFACDHEGVVPDLLCIGKGMAGGMPISACVGRPGVMASFGESTGEALHTQTFLGHPLGAAAALASIEVLLSEDLANRAAHTGTWLKGELNNLRARHPCVGPVRGRGLMLGVELHDDKGQPAPGLAVDIMCQALRRGLILLPEGAAGHILGINPPLTITREQLCFALEVLDDLLPVG